MTTELRKYETRARRLAAKQEFVIRKSRRQYEQQYRYCVVDPRYNRIEYYASSIEEVIEWLTPE